MSKFTNFVRGQLVESIDDDPGTEIKLEFEAPLQPPADPGGERARLILMDDARRPTQFETIAFTGHTTSGGVQTLTGVERGMDGTSALSWDEGAVVGQDLPAEILQVLGAEPEEEDVLMLGSENLFGYAQVKHEKILKKPVQRNALYLEENPSPSVPQSGESHLYLAPGRQLKTIFDDGSSSYVIQPPTAEEVDASFSGSNNKASVSLPAGASDGDAVLIAIALANGVGSVGITPPAGMSEIARYEDGWTHPTVAVFYGVADTSSTNYAFTFDQTLDSTVTLITVVDASSSPVGATESTTSSTSSVSESVSQSPGSIAIGFAGIYGGINGSGAGDTETMLSYTGSDVSVVSVFSYTGVVDVDFQSAASNALVVVAMER